MNNCFQNFSKTPLLRLTVLPWYFSAFVWQQDKVHKRFEKQLRPLPWLCAVYKGHAHRGLTAYWSKNHFRYIIPFTLKFAVMHYALRVCSLLPCIILGGEFGWYSQLPMSSVNPCWVAPMRTRWDILDEWPGQTCKVSKVMFPRRTE